MKLSTEPDIRMTRIGTRNVQTQVNSVKRERSWRQTAVGSEAALPTIACCIRTRQGNAARSGAALSGSIAHDPKSQVTLTGPGLGRSGARNMARAGQRGGRKSLNSTHLWQGVAPGSDGQTQRIFERAQDWHARGRYFWTSGVARERSPDAGVESGIVTASRASGEGRSAWVDGRVLVLVLGLGLGLCFLGAA